MSPPFPFHGYRRPMELDAKSCVVCVFTFKDGLLGKLGHDLVFDVDRLSAQIEGNQVRVEIEGASLRVRGAMEHGRVQAVSDRDRADIEGNARKVLDVGKHPTIHFEGVREDDRVRGALTLHGVRRELAFAVTTEGPLLAASIPIHQPDFGIAPFKAALGALRLKPDVRVEVRIDQRSLAGNASV